MQPRSSRRSPLLGPRPPVSKPESVYPIGAPRPSVQLETEAQEPASWSRWAQILAAVETRRDEWLNTMESSCHSSRRRDGLSQLGQEGIAKRKIERQLKLLKSADQVEQALSAAAEDTLYRLDKALVDQSTAGQPICCYREPAATTAGLPIRLDRIRIHLQILDMLVATGEARTAAATLTDRLRERLDASTARSRELETSLKGTEARLVSSIAAAQAEISQLRAECVELQLQVDREKAQANDSKRRVRTAQDIADVMAAAYAARSADADLLKAALDDSEARLKDQERRAAAAEQAILDENSVEHVSAELEDKLRVEGANVADLTAVCSDLEQRLAAESAKRIETERVLQNVFKDVVIERDRANNEKARADALVPELERIKQHVLLLRGKLTAFATALSHPQQYAINDIPPDKIAAAIFRDVEAMQRTFDAGMPT